LPQDRRTIEYSTFSETGKLAFEIDHHDLFDIEDAAKLLSLFLREKDEGIAEAWPKKRLREFIVSQLKSGGHDETFLSKMVFQFIPRVIRDAIYDLVARNRYRWFGRRDACIQPNSDRSWPS
jgi:hypothetical protein